MNEELEKIKNNFKQKRQRTIRKELFIMRNINRFLVVIVLTLFTLIFLKSNLNFRELFYNNVFEKNFSFAKVNKLYEQYFGSPIPFNDLINKQATYVFQEKLEYSESNKYKDGVALKVYKDYLVPSLNEGIVIFIGDKDEYPQTVIIQQANGIDVWYSNINNLTVKLYDYVEKNAPLGEVIDDNLYLVFKKGADVLDYNDFI